MIPLPRKQRTNMNVLRNTDKEHKCSFGDLDKRTKDKLTKIFPGMLFLKCECCAVRPLNLEEFQKEFTNGKRKQMDDVLKRKRLHLACHIF